MKVTIARHNKDRYIIIENEKRTVTYKVNMLTRTSTTSHSGTEDFVYESEIFEATFLREELNEMTNYEKERKEESEEKDV